MPPSSSACEDRFAPELLELFSRMSRSFSFLSGMSASLRKDSCSDGSALARTLRNADTVIPDDLAGIVGDSVSPGWATFVRFDDDDGSSCAKLLDCAADVAASPPCLKEWRRWRRVVMREPFDGEDPDLKEPTVSARTGGILLLPPAESSEGSAPGESSGSETGLQPAPSTVPDPSPDSSEMFTDPGR
eukprot:CAMPEP_0180155804 /NCGR_PEP_ID=MMETSP0986-20121125/25114_1 /TAXON_ID=697907 /ORGANISM="non described non described, Strain CCMP2293" /LENGTH=187 /DNA_ID=CAMNT_0022104703 /DNA_START=204 /DNA_END=767 /DNA_ORIENTATION=-